MLHLTLREQIFWPYLHNEDQSCLVNRKEPCRLVFGALVQLRQARLFDHLISRKKLKLRNRL